MKNLLAISGTLLILLSMSFSPVKGADGDTTVITSHDKQHLKFPPSNRTYTNTVKFPDGSVKYRKILMEYTLGCPSTGCSTWDYTTSVEVLRPTGTFDSTLTQYPYFKVDGSVVDSAIFSLNKKFITFFDTTNKITDSVAADTVLFRIYGDSTMPTVQTDSFFAYLAGYMNYYYDANGVIIDSNFVKGDSLWYQSLYNVYNKFEVKDRFELGRLITPYFGDYYPYTFTFDVTDYATLLKDSADISIIFSGWQNGFLATIDFKFIEGTPPRDPKRVTSLYKGNFQYGRVNNRIETHLVPTDIDFYNDEAGAVLNYTPSGHSFGGNENCAEFCKKNFHVLVNSSKMHTDAMWRDDCGRNPLYPQGGTWIYNRANWCPGLDAIRHTVELTPNITFGTKNEINIDLDPYTYNGSAAPGTTPNPSWTIDATIITFGAPNFTLDAEIQEIIAPNNHILKNRDNPICGSPIVRIRNTGSTTLSSLVITYGPKGGKTASYTWNGSLDFLESEVVELPSPDWSPWNGPNIYEVSVSSPNGGTDGYAENNTIASKFDIPEQWPNEFVLYFKSSQATQNKYGIVDDQGKVVFAKNAPQNNNDYHDTLTLERGCYEFYITDVVEDGLKFFGQTTGNLLILDPEKKNKKIRSFELEFGSELRARFTVGYELTGINSNMVSGKREWQVFPNPNNGQFILELDQFKNEIVNISIHHILGTEVHVQKVRATDDYFQENINLHGLTPGIYMVVIQSGDYNDTRKIIIQ